MSSEATKALRFTPRARASASSSSTTDSSTHTDSTRPDIPNSLAAALAALPPWQRDLAECIMALPPGQTMLFGIPRPPVLDPALVEVARLFGVRLVSAVTK